MGHLHYAPNQVFEFDDYLLTHLRTVIVSKLLQRESFLFTWSNEGSQQSIWLHPALSLSFEFEHEEVAPVNREWVNDMLALAHSPGGLRIVPEPKPPASEKRER